MCLSLSPPPSPSFPSSLPPVSLQILQTNLCKLVIFFLFLVWLPWRLTVWFMYPLKGGNNWRFKKVLILCFSVTLGNLGTQILFVRLLSLSLSLSLPASKRLPVHLKGNVKHDNSLEVSAVLYKLRYFFLSYQFHFHLFV